MPADMLVGRRLAIGALDSAVDAAVGGAGGVVLLAGEAGMGKTALASEAAARAKARGAETVWGTCWDGDGAPGFWPWIQAVRALVPDGADAAAALVASMPSFPAGYRWRHTAMLTTEAELAAAVADPRRCTALYEQLLPMADEFAVVGAAVFTTGPVSLQLGLLAAALGRAEDAAAHLGAAARSCERLGAPLLAARARAERARVLGARGHPAAEGRDQDSGCVFRRDGDLWTAAFGGQTVTLRDAKGLRDLAVLLAAPGGEVAATELVAGGDGGTATAIDTLGADSVLDDRARAAYRTRLADLDDELAEADAHHDIGRSARLAAERDALIGELARATGLSGRRRRLGDATERARTTVTARIRDAIGRIERIHPELGRHLRASIVTGARCAYRPAATMRWSISQS